MLRKSMVGTVDMLNGETLFYREVMGIGDENILLIHGNLSSSKHWEPILDLFPMDYRIHAVDLRGMGKSSYNHPFDSLEELATDLHQFLQRKNLKNVTVVGWSTGGGIALELAANYPQLVKSLVLVSSVSYKGYPIWKKNEKGEPLVGMAYESKAEMAQDPIQVAPVLMALETKDEALMRRIWDLGIYVHKKPEEGKYQEYLEATFEQRNLLDIDWALACFNLSNGHNGMLAGSGKIKEVQVPVLALRGDSDAIVTQEMVAETVKALGDQARLEELPQCGHSPLVDCPEVLVNKIINFIEEVR